MTACCLSTLRDWGTQRTQAAPSKARPRRQRHPLQEAPPSHHSSHASPWASECVCAGKPARPDLASGLRICPHAQSGSSHRIQLLPPQSSSSHPTWLFPPRPAPPTPLRPPWPLQSTLPSQGLLLGQQWGLGTHWPSRMDAHSLGRAGAGSPEGSVKGWGRWEHPPTPRRPASPMGAHTTSPSDAHRHARLDGTLHTQRSRRPALLPRTCAHPGTTTPSQATPDALPEDSRPAPSKVELRATARPLHPPPPRLGDRGRHGSRLSASLLRHRQHGCLTGQRVSSLSPELPTPRPHHCCRPWVCLGGNHVPPPEEPQA